MARDSDSGKALDWRRRVRRLGRSRAGGSARCLVTARARSAAAKAGGEQGKLAEQTKGMSGKSASLADKAGVDMDKSDAPAGDIAKGVLAPNPNAGGTVTVSASDGCVTGETTVVFDLEVTIGDPGNPDDWTGAVKTGKDAPERVGAQWVAADFFRVLDVTPSLGRTFIAEDGEPNAPDVVVISSGLWQSWFGGDPGVVGQTLNIAGRQSTVVGVMPAGFRFMNDTDLWAPVRMGMFDTEGRRSHSWQVVGRLKDDVTLGQAQAQMDVISAQLAEAYPEKLAELIEIFSMIFGL